ncbi:MAG: hypothetical protein AAF696_22450 [Bacteroidota bacterium]
MKKTFVFLFACLLFSCTTLQESEEISPSNQFSQKEQENLVELDLKSKQFSFSRGPSGCDCMFSLEVSSNLVGEEWFADFSFEEGGQTITYNIDGAANPNLPNPFILNSTDITKGQIIPSTLRMLYDPLNQLKKPGWIKFTVACEQAPSYTHYLEVPDFDISGSVFSTQEVQITKNCGTIEIDDE